jgi:hypothetical protein
MKDQVKLFYYNNILIILPRKIADYNRRIIQMFKAEQEKQKVDYWKLLNLNMRLCLS